MSTGATDPAASASPADNSTVPLNASSSADKGKGKGAATDAMDDDEDDDDEEEEEEEEDGEDDDEEDSEEEEDSRNEIDLDNIQPRRTRGVKVDYTSPEALAKAGLTEKDVAGDDEDDRDVEMKDE